MWLQKKGISTLNDFNDILGKGVTSGLVNLAVDHLNPASDAIDHLNPALDAIEDSRVLSQAEIRSVLEEGGHAHATSFSPAVGSGSIPCYE